MTLTSKGEDIYVYWNTYKIYVKKIKLKNNLI